MSISNRQPIHSIAVQQLRGIAALLVVWFHAMEQMPGLAALLGPSWGYLGVDIFFAISGFVMIVSTRKSGVHPAEFVMQRLIRVAPMYWLFTLLVAALAVALPQLFRSTDPSLRHVLQSLLFWPHWSPTHPGKLWPVLVPGWSLNYEMFFYLLFGASLWLRPALRLPVLTVLFVALYLAGRVAGAIESAPLTLITDPVILEFIAGAWVAQLVLRHRDDRPVSTGWPALLIGALLLLVHAYLSPGRLFVLAGSTLLVFGAAHLRGPIIQAACLTHLGDASYSLYLSHLFVLGAARSIWLKSMGSPASAGGSLAFVCLCLVASSLVAVWIHRSVEVPLTNRLRAAWKARQPVVGS